MVAVDQPDFLPNGVCVRVSSRNNGTMLDRSGATPGAKILRNRQQFTKINGIVYEDCVNQYITYEEGAAYDRIVEVDTTSTRRFTEGVNADALFTRTLGVGLFLPVGDCVATIVFDPAQQQLALLHLGRHSTLSDLIPSTIAKFIAAESDPRNLVVWMGPSIQRASYRLEYFAQERDTSWQGFYERRGGGVYIDMQGYNRQRFMDEGILADNIYLSSIDTATSPDYFSHAMGDKHGRMAVLAYLR